MPTISREPQSVVSTTPTGGPAGLRVATRGPSQLGASTARWLAVDPGPLAEAPLPDPPLSQAGQLGTSAAEFFADDPSDLLFASQSRREDSGPSSSGIDAVRAPPVFDGQSVTDAFVEGLVREEEASYSLMGWRWVAATSTHSARLFILYGYLPVTDAANGGAGEILYAVIAESPGVSSFAGYELVQFGRGVRAMALTHTTTAEHLDPVLIGTQIEDVADAAGEGEVGGGGVDPGEANDEQDWFTMSVTWEITIDRTTVSRWSLDQVVSVYHHLTFVKDYYLADGVYSVCPESYGGLGGFGLTLWEPRTYVTLGDGSGFWAAIQNVPAIDPENPTELEDADDDCVSVENAPLNACDTMPALAAKAFACVALPESGASLTDPDNPLFALYQLLVGLAPGYDVNTIVAYCEDC